MLAGAGPAQEPGDGTSLFGTTVGALRKHVDRWAGRDFVVAAGGSITYGDFYRRVNRLAHWLLEHGVRRGSNVGLLMFNSPELYISLLAVHRVGAIANLWNFRLAAGDIRYLAQRTRTAAVVVSPELIPLVNELSGCTLLATGMQPPRAGVGSFGELGGMPDAEPPVQDPDEMGLASVIYTSGTTGRPKGASYTHRTQLLSAVQYCLEMGLDPGRRGLSAAPVIHGGATNFFFAYLFIGASFIDSGTYSAERIVDLARAHEATELMAVPTQIVQMLRVVDERGIPAGEFASLRLIRTAGSPYPKSLVLRVHEAFGCPLLNTFGMTENCANVTSMHSGYDPEEAWTTIGKPTYFWDARAVRVDEAQPAPGDTVIPPGRGQLIVRGPQNIERYYLSDQAPPYRQGWLYARDVVDVGSSGYMQVVDRLDETILTGGEIVYPQEVEAVLTSHPLVEDAAVIGVADPEWGEAVVAVVAPKTPDLTESDLEAHCLASGVLARYKRPRRVIFAEQIPRNVFGKVERYKLRARYGGRETPGPPGAATTG